MAFSWTSGTTNSVVLWGAPVFVAAGETLHAVMVDAPGAPAMKVVVLDSTGAEVAQIELDIISGGDRQRTYVQLADTSVVYYFFIVMEADSADFGSWTLEGIRIWPATEHFSSNGETIAQEGSPMPVPTAASGQFAAIETLHDEYFVDDYPTPSHVVSKLNRAINALHEALTGGPADGNDEVTNSDSGAADPATSRFVAHTRAGADLAAEPKIDFPVLSEGLGAIGLGGDAVVGDAAATTGIREWFAPFPTSTSETTCRRVPVYIPDLPDGDLYATFLCASDTGSPTSWKMRANIGSGSSSQVSVAQLGGTAFYVCTVGPISSVERDQPIIASFTAEKTGGGDVVFEEISFVGWSIYFAP
jgi:hypothetical protein